MIRIFISRFAQTMSWSFWGKTLTKLRIKKRFKNFFRTIVTKFVVILFTFYLLLLIKVIRTVTSVTWWHAFSPIPIFHFFFFKKLKKKKNSFYKKNFKNTRHTRHTRHSLIIHLFISIFYYHLWCGKVKNIKGIEIIEWWRVVWRVCYMSIQLVTEYYNSYMYIFV